MITLLLADPVGLLRGALRVSLEEHADVTVIAEAADARTAILEAQRTRPSVGILSSVLPGSSLGDLCGAIRSTVPAMRLLVVSEADEPWAFQQSMRSGADGYLTMDLEVESMVNAVRWVNFGQTFVQGSVLRHLLDTLVERQEEEDEIILRFCRLSDREREVLSLLVEGLDQKGIAARLILSPHTARTHIQNVLQGLAVHSRLQAVALTTRYDLLRRFGGAAVNNRASAMNRL
jgi:DNA-binding NarL/FixJ family response regulator